MNRENSDPQLTDENDGAAVYKHYSSLLLIISIPMGEGAVPPFPPVATLLFDALIRKQLFAFVSRCQNSSKLLV